MFYTQSQQNTYPQCNPPAIGLPPSQSNDHMEIIDYVKEGKLKYEVSGSFDLGLKDKEVVIYDIMTITIDTWSNLNFPKSFTIEVEEGENHTYKINTGKDFFEIKKLINEKVTMEVKYTGDMGLFLLAFNLGSKQDQFKKIIRETSGIEFYDIIDKGRNGNGFIFNKPWKYILATIEDFAKPKLLCNQSK